MSDYNGSSAADEVFKTVKDANEPVWLNLCVLQAGQKLEVALQLDCVKAIAEYGMESFKQEARLRDGAKSVRRNLGGRGAVAEMEVLRGAEALLKANGEELAEVSATICVRARKMPLDLGSSGSVIGKPLDFYVPVTLRLGKDEDRVDDSIDKIYI